MRRRIKTLFATLLAASLLPFAGFGQEKVSRPFEHKGYSKPEYQGIRKVSDYAVMSDGTRLAVDAYIPAEGPGDGPFPVILEYTPYTRAFVDLKNGPVHKSLRQIVLKSKDPVIDLRNAPESMGKAIKDIISYGYVFVRADMRGSGASSGWKADFMPQLAKDGGELIDWIAEQDWCDGNVGMMGGSYTGYSQIVTAGHAGPALKCIAPMMVPLDGYNGEVYPGGVYLHGFMTEYSEGLTRLNLNYYQLNIGKVLIGKGGFMLPAAPVVDEDGDGELFDEVPVDKNRNGTFLDDYLYPADPSDEPEYKDGERREHLYYMASLDHEKNLDYHSWAKDMYFLDAVPPYPLHNASIYEFSPSSHVPAIMKKGIAVYNVGGWFDTFVRGTTEYFATMEKTNPSRMLIVPGFHGGGGPYWEYLGEAPDILMDNGFQELLRFYDRYLKGIDNGIDREPPVLIYVMNGEGFRQENEWPLARGEERKLYFGPGNSLSDKRGTPGHDRYVAEFTHDARWGKKKGNRWLATMGRAPDALPIRTALDKKCLTYTSQPMAADTEVTGHPVVRFWVSSSADYGDFFVYLSDVDEKGEAVQVTEGVLRAGFAKMVDNDEAIMGGGSGVDVLPDLPWHGYESTDYVHAIFAGGNVVELEFDLKPTSWVFRRGHSIRVSIACADWPTFRLHPRLCPDNDPENPANIVPIITVFRDDKRPSYITLPVIP